MMTRGPESWNGKKPTTSRSWGRRMGPRSVSQELLVPLPDQALRGRVLPDRCRTWATCLKREFLQEPYATSEGTGRSTFGKP